MHLLPCAVSKHGPDAPRRAKDVESLGEAVVVNEARVNGEDAHEEDEIAPVEEGVPDLWRGQRGQRSVSSDPDPGAVSERMSPQPGTQALSREATW